MATNYSNSYLRNLNEDPEEFPYDPDDYNHCTDDLMKYIEQGTIIEIQDPHGNRKYHVVKIDFCEGEDDFSFNKHFYPKSYYCTMCSIDKNPYESLRDSDYFYHSEMVYVNGEVLSLFKNNTGKTAILGMSEFNKPDEQISMF